MDNLRGILADTFYTLRNEKKETLVEIASRMNTGTKQLWRLEKGKVDPHLSTIERLADALGYSVKIVFVVKNDE